MKILRILIFLSTLCSSAVYAESSPTSATKSSAKTVIFRYNKKRLSDIINELAALKNINILLPQPQDDKGKNALNVEVTYTIDEPISLDEAWQRLLTILSVAGFTTKPNGNMLAIVPNDMSILKEPLPLYINVPLAQLPDGDNIIRALFYFNNLKISNDPKESPAYKIATDFSTMVQNNTLQPGAIIADKKTNALIVTDRASTIKGMMTVLQELENHGLREVLEIIPLFYTDATNVQLILSQITGFDPNAIAAGAGLPNQPTSPTAYFPKNIRFKALDRTNSMIVMGSQRGVRAVKDFIVKYLDQPLESGESILHVYELQYLKAKELEPILTNIVRGPSGGTLQGTAKATTSGGKQYFQNVIIKAEEISYATQLSASATKNISKSDVTHSSPTLEPPKRGGNRLVVAARKKDWLRIKTLIESLDKPELQIALDILVVDLVYDKNLTLGDQMRDKSGLLDSISRSFNFQFAGLAAPVLTGANTSSTLPADALQSNLLQVTSPSGGTPFNLASLLANSSPGSFILSLKDPNAPPGGGIWSLWQILNQYTNTSLIAQPFLITTNNQEARVSVSENRLLRDVADQSNAGAVDVKFRDVPAQFAAKVLPRIDRDNNINMQIDIMISQYSSAIDNSRRTRLVRTCANVGNGEILALGGLMRTEDDINIQQVPVLGSIPIVGWFFKQETKTLIKSNLLVFICPTVIPMHAKDGMDPFSYDKMSLVQGDLDASIALENLRDPITRWFFKPQTKASEEVIDDYCTRFQCIPAYVPHVHQDVQLPDESVPTAPKDKLQTPKKKAPLAPITQDSPSQPKRDATPSEFSPEAQELKKLLAHEPNPLARCS